MCDIQLDAMHFKYRGCFVFTIECAMTLICRPLRVGCQHQTSPLGMQAMVQSCAVTSVWWKHCRNDCREWTLYVIPRQDCIMPSLMVTITSVRRGKLTQKICMFLTLFSLFASNYCVRKGKLHSFEVCVHTAGRVRIWLGTVGL